MKLYWIDIETTGLSTINDQILEIAIAESELLDPFIYRHIFHAVIGHNGEGLSSYIKDFHAPSGLLAECRESIVTVEAAEKELLSLIPWVEDREERPTMAGSSVHFDHEFIKWHMPELNKRFSHRHYDVSAVKLFCQSLGMPKPPKAEAHRAKADIEESIAHALQCANWIGGRDALGKALPGFSVSA